LLLETAVADFAQPVEEHSAGQRIARFAAWSNFGKYLHHIRQTA
jgi:hypothetical protein